MLTLSAIAMLSSGTVPPVLSNTYAFLTGIAPEMALGCFVIATFAFRSGGENNFGLDGGFVKWIIWGLIFTGINTLPMILNAANVNMCIPTGGTAPAYLSGLQALLTNFVGTYLIKYVVPAAAAVLVLKALLDSAEGKSPVPSIVSALLVLSVSGFATLANSVVNTTNEFGIATGMLGMVNWFGTNVCPAVACLCVIGAIFNYIRNRPWGQLAITAIAMLCFTGLLQLVEAWG